jgi:hypothetical protein
MHLLFTVLIILAYFGAPLEAVWQPTKVNLLMNLVYRNNAGDGAQVLT